MRKAVFCLVAGLGGVIVGGVLALAVSIEVWAALVVLGVVIVMFVHIERSIEMRRTATEPVLDDKEQRLGELISKRCDRVWEGIRDRRYVKHEGGQVTDLDGGAIFSEIRDIVEEVAALYHADSDNAVLEARIGDIALAIRSATDDFLQLVRRVPYVDPANWSVREVMTRLEQIQKGLALYRKVSPHWHFVRAASIAARVAAGMNPISIMAWTIVVEVIKRGVKTRAEVWLKALLESLVGLVYLQVARMYAPRLAYRSVDDRESDSRTIPQQRRGIADRLRDVLFAMKDLRRCLKRGVGVDVIRSDSPDCAHVERRRRGRIRSAIARLPHRWRPGRRRHRGAENSP